MKTKIVYVVISSPNDIYLDQTILSIKSLRHFHPKAVVELLLDSSTFETLRENRGTIKDLVNEIHVISVPDELSAQHRASWLKTTMREHIVGDFLFVDSDTYINNPISEIDDIEGVVCAVPDAHMCFSEHFQRIKYEVLFKKIGLTSPVDNYYNSGVLKVSDDSEAYSFFKLWHETWKANKEWCKYDQPFMAYADSKLHLITEMSPFMNCQVPYAVKFFKQAKIVHYFASNFIFSTEKRPFKLMNKDFFVSMRTEDYDITDIISFGDIDDMFYNVRTEIMDGDIIELCHSYQMKVLLGWYKKHNKMFQKIEKLLSKLSINK